MIELKFTSSLLTALCLSESWPGTIVYGPTFKQRQWVVGKLYVGDLTTVHGLDAWSCYHNPNAGLWS